MSETAKSTWDAAPGRGSCTAQRTYVCGHCRDILAPGLDPDQAIVSRYNEQADTFTTVSRFRDIVIRCKGCGAYNEPPTDVA
jgi:hypothetical protein